MEKKPIIKVVKRSQRKEADGALAETETKKSAQQSARDMMATVTGWVNEFQQRRRDETRQALKTIFADSTPRPSQV